MTTLHLPESRSPSLDPLIDQLRDRRRPERELGVTNPPPATVLGPGRIEPGRLTATPITFLFTDIVDSTALWERSPAAMRRALAVHDERCRTAASRLRAEVFSTTGDGFGIAFHHVDAAVEAAVGLQALLVDISHAFGIGLRVRMGLHRGRVERRGDNYFGPVLNRASRLMRRAEGGQVVVSAAVAERLTSTRVRVEPLGSWHLRGIDEPVTAFLATARRRPAMANLPVLRTAGRPQASTTDRSTDPTQQHQQHQQHRAAHGAPPRRDQP